jgi:RNA recognition motif-containing protein
MKIYIGNLNEVIEDIHLVEAFKDYGTVNSAKVMRDKYTGKSRCFGFITMPDNDEALNAIDTLDGGLWEGKTIVVKKAFKKAN